MNNPPTKKIINGFLDFIKKYGLTILAVVLLIFIYIIFAIFPRDFKNIF